MSEMFELHDQRYVLNGRLLAAARRKLELTMSEFAARCDWSPQYQWKLEHGEGQNTVSEGTKNVIENALKEAADERQDSGYCG
jgi:transcriptional regulator with XRE-family HTH domain